MSDPKIPISNHFFYQMFSNLGYTPWTALSEFIDNSITSWISQDYENQRLEIEITSEPDEEGWRLKISDNAYGIQKIDLERAFSISSPPGNGSHALAKFGMGMKTAAFWFGEKLTVETSAIGEPLARTVHFDVAKIATSADFELEVHETPARADEHFTRLVITGLIQQISHSKTITKTKVYLAKLFRKYIETGNVVIRWNGEELSYRSPQILVAPPFTDDSENPSDVRWETHFKIDLGEGKVINGYACIFDSFNRQYAGLNFFWRNRLVKGNIEPFHKPQQLFGQPSSFRSGRLYIEIIADDFDIAIGKTTFNFGRSQIGEEILNQLVLDALKVTDLPISIIQQAENYRKKT